MSNFLANVLLAAAVASAQVAVHIGKNHQQVKRTLRPVIARANASTVRVYGASRPQDVALGAIVTPTGYVLTVAGNLAEPLACLLPDGRRLAAAWVGTNAAYDLALLKIDARNLKPVIWRRGPPPTVGSLLATPGRGPDPVALGVVSVDPRPAAGQPATRFVHDTFLRQNDCGGPVVDFDGNAVGINIARVDRVTTAAVAAQTVLAVLAKLLAGVTAPPPRAAAARGALNTGTLNTGAATADLRQLQARIRTVAAIAIARTVQVRLGQVRGSGVLVSPNGYVLTAAHVSQDAGRTVEVSLADGRTVPGKSLGANHQADVGLIKIDPPGPWPGLNKVRLAAARRGQWCVATGHPSGTQSRPAAVLRVGRVLGRDSSGIVTDCSLMRGDSGGPLFDLDGNLVGIHIRIGRNLAGNLHAPASAIRRGWPRLARGDVWGRPAAGKGPEGVNGAKRQGTRDLRDLRDKGPKGPKGPKGHGT